ncbi:MAG: phosphodiester glycosidase family protein [Legionellaceae bacterium]|nr:phosphodiester glycosidase family protein [Legionellaceae bacterium]
MHRLKHTVSLFLFFTSIAFANGQWKTLLPGLEYQDLQHTMFNPFSHVHVFRIDLQHFDLGLLPAKTLNQKHASVDSLVQHSHALLGINAGFFDLNYKPLGLRIHHYQEYSSLKKISWWGVFYIRHQKASIASVKNFEHSPDIAFAVQSGPRLLINGHIPPLRPGRAERTALGVTPDNKVIILVTDNFALSTTELAQMMKDSPILCNYALNLDGGSSTQLQVQIPSFSLEVHGLSQVSDAIVLFPHS